jgi:hypothetical protein
MTGSTGSSARQSRAKVAILAEASSWLGAGLAISRGVESSMPSAMLEQQAQTFGLRDLAFSSSDIGSPQHLQIQEFIRSCEVNLLRLK